MTQLINHSLSLVTARRIKIKFTHANDGPDTIVELGQDAGGLFNEWMIHFFDQAFDPHRGLFVSAGDPGATIYQFAPQSDPQLLLPYRLIGTMTALALVFGVPVGRLLPPALYHLMLRSNDQGRMISNFSTDDYMRILQEVSPLQHGWLEHLRNTEEDVKALDLEFGIINPTSGELQPLSVMKDADEKVSPANKEEYVALMAEYLLLERNRDSVQAFLDGFWNAIEPRDLWVFRFTTRELEACICGQRKISVGEWQRGTQCVGDEGGEHQVIKWFWEYLKQGSQERRQQVLRYATGLLRLPIDGFTGVPGGQFTIIMASHMSTNWHMPRGITCSSTLILYPYESREELERWLEKAIALGSTGFGIC